MRNFVLPVLFMLALACSCGGGNGNHAPHVSEPELTLPFPADRRSSVPFETSIDGSAFVDSEGPPRVTTFNETAILQSNDFVNAWAIWQFPQADDPILEVSLELRIEEDNSGFIGLADYELSRWTFIPAQDGSQTVSIDQARNVSPVGNVFIAAIALRGDKVLADRFTITVDKTGWHVIPVATDGDVGKYCSILEVDGKPAIACQQTPEGEARELAYYYSLDELGLYADDWFGITVDNSGSLGFSTDLAVIDGNPAIAYQKDNKLFFTRSSTNKGHGPANWGSKVTIDDDIQAGSELSLATVDGDPALAYRVGGTSDELRYAISTSPDGMDPGDWSTRAIESGGDTGYYPSLNVIDGNPAVAYYDAGNERLAYIRSTTARGDGVANWLQYVPLLDEGMFNDFQSPPCLLLADGKPGIVYIDSGQDELRWLYSGGSADGSLLLDWDRDQLLDADLDIAGNLDAAIVDGNPACVYRDDVNEQVYYLRSETANGVGLDMSWSRTEVFSPSDDSSVNHLSMALVASRPVICFHRGSADDTHDDLYYAVLLD